MDEAQILQRLRAIGGEIATGKAPHVIFDSIVEAVRDLGFDRVRLDLLSPDGASITPAAARGFDGNGLGEPVPADEDPDVACLTMDLRPQINPGENGTGEHGIAPLLLRGKLAGKLVVEHAQGGGPVSQADLDTVLLFAQQAAIAQAMLWAGSLESLQQTTLAITSVRDPRTLLDTIVEQAVKLLGAESGGIYEYRPEIEELVVIAEYKRPYEGRKLRLGHGMAGRIIQERLPYMVVSNYNKWDGRADIYGDDRSFEAVLEVPLRWENSYTGVLYVDDELGRTFTDTDIYLLRLFADQAAICLANSNLLQGDAKKLQRLEQLASATREMMGGLEATSLRERLDMIARHVAEILDAETSGVFLVHGEALVLEASHGQRPGFDLGQVKPLRIHDEPGGGLTGFIAFHRVPFKGHGEPLKQHQAVAHASPHTPSGDCYSLLAIPLIKQVGEKEELVGLIRADNKKGGENDEALATLGFSQEDEWILTIFAEAAIVAIESAELVNRLREQGDFRQRLISSSPDGIIAIDRQGLITELNDQAETILEYTREEMIGRPVASLYLDPQEPRLIGRRLYGESDHHVRDYETFVVSKAGVPIPIRQTSTWLVDATGDRVGSVGYFEDLRKQRDLERRERLLLKASKGLAEAGKLDDGLQGIADMLVTELGCSFCGILLMEEDGRSLNLRAEKVVGEPDRELRGKQIVLAEWKGLAELLGRGRPWVRESTDPQYRAMLDRLAGVLGFERSIEVLLVVPLKIADRVVGQLDLGDLAGGKNPSFSDKEVDLVAAVAAQITGLIQRFQLLETTIRREELLKALVQASPHIHAGAEIKVLQQTVVRLAAEMVDCRIGGLFLHRHHLGQLELVAVHGAPEELVGEQLFESEGLVGTVTRSGETAFSQDPQEDLFHSLELKTVAVVPFRRGSGEVEAVLFVGSSSPREPFSLVDLQILDAFATQATIALETARLMDREQLYGRQMATLHRISDYIQGADTLEKIVHSVLTGVTASYGLGFNRAVLLLVDETGDYLVAEMGIGETDEGKAREGWKAAAEIDDFERYLKRREKGEVPETTVGRKIRGLRLPIHESGVLSEALASAKYCHVPARELERVPKALQRAIQARTPLEVAPLMAKGQVIGLIVADNKFTQAPVGEDLSNALMTFASTAAVAIENKRLFDQTRSGAEKLMAFYQMTGELIGLSEPRTILQRIVGQTLSAAGASWVSIVLIDKSGRAINAIESSSHISLQESATLLIRPEGISMRVMSTGQAFPIENVAKTRDKVNPVLMRRSVQAAICLPMSLPGKPLGVMWIHYDEPHRFPESEVAALQLYVNQAAIAYESSRRTETLEAMRATFKALAEVDDTRSLLDRIVRGAQGVLKADEAVLWLYDAKTDDFIPESSTYAGDHPVEWSELQKNGPQHRGTAFRIMEHAWMSVEDLQDPEQRKILGSTTLRFLEQIHGYGFQGAALKVGREKLGVLYAIYLKPCRFHEEERDTALAFANHAALALKKAKLLDQVQRAREAAEVVARVTLLEDPQHTLLSIVQETKRALECGAVVLFQYDEDTGTLLHPTTVTGVIPLAEETPPDHSLVLAMVERDGPYIVPDVEHDQKFKDSPFAQSQGIQSFVAVPLKAAARRVGVMFVNYRNQRRFTADELTNIELFANQAAVAIRNIQLFEESTAKLKQQETLAELSREFLLAKSVQDMMDRAVEFAARVLGTDFSNIVLPSRDGRLLFSAAVGWPEEVVGNQYLDRVGSQTGFTIRKREPVAIYDFRTVKEFKVPEIVFEQGIQSGLSVPMLLGGRTVGAMLVHTKRPRRFTDDDKLLLSLIANQTATALERLRQYEASRRKSLYLEALYDVAKAITKQAGRELRQILDEIGPKMGKVVGFQGPAPVLGAILLYNEDTDELIPVSVHPKEQSAEIERQFGKRYPKALQAQGERIGVTGRAVLTRTPQLVKDVGKNPDYIVCPAGIKSELAMPLIDRDLDEVIGVLNVESDQLSAFDEDDQDALKALAELVVLAILNSHRFEELRTKRTIAWMGLRNAVARHEDFGQLATVLPDLYTLENLVNDPKVSWSATALRIVSEIEGKLKEVGSKELTADASEKLSSIFVNRDLLHAFTGSLAAGHPVRSANVVLQLDCALDGSACILANAHWLFAVLDILVRNAVQAKATAITLGSRSGQRKGSPKAEIFICDNGRGIPPEMQAKLLKEPVRSSQGHGAGLLIAKDIVETYKGTIELKVGDPRGTVFVLSFPLETPPGGSAQEEAEVTANV